MRPGAPGADVSHGICARCAGEFGTFPVDDLSALPQAEYDQLPVGLIELDGQGVVRTYNRAESRRAGRRPANVLGRNFFNDVAPCTQVKEFEGRFRAMVASGEAGTERFEFIFQYGGGQRLMRIALAAEPQRGRVMVLVRDA